MEDKSGARARRAVPFQPPSEPRRRASLSDSLARWHACGAESSFLRAGGCPQQTQEMPSYRDRSSSPSLCCYQSISPEIFGRVWRTQGVDGSRKSLARVSDTHRASTLMAISEATATFASVFLAGFWGVASAVSLASALGCFVVWPGLLTAFFLALRRGPCDGIHTKHAHHNNRRRDQCTATASGTCKICQ